MNFHWDFKELHMNWMFIFNTIMLFGNLIFACSPYWAYNGNSIENPEVNDNQCTWKWSKLMICGNRFIQRFIRIRWYVNIRNTWYHLKDIWKSASCIIVYCCKTNVVLLVTVMIFSRITAFRTGNYVRMCARRNLFCDVGN